MDPIMLDLIAAVIGGDPKARKRLEAIHAENVAAQPAPPEPDARTRSEAEAFHRRFMERLQRSAKVEADAAKEANP